MIDDAQSTLAASLTLDPSQFEGPCPVNLDARGVIGSAVPGRIRYWFRRSDGGETPPVELVIAAPGTLIAKTNMPGVGKDEWVPTSGWLELMVQPLPQGSQIASPQARYAAVFTNTQQG